MRIENLDRAIVAKKELKSLDRAIAEFDKQLAVGDIAFMLCAHSDMSGFCVDHQFKNGNSHPMYKEIFEFAYKKFQEAKNDLIKEIESL